MIELLEPSRVGTRCSRNARRRRDRGTVSNPSSVVRTARHSISVMSAVNDAPATFPERLSATVSTRPDHPAVLSDETLTYAELERALRPHGACAARNRRRQGHPDRACSHPTASLWLTTFYAGLRIGALVTPISTLATPPSSRTSCAPQRRPAPDRRAPVPAPRLRRQPQTACAARAARRPRGRVRLTEAPLPALGLARQRRRAVAGRDRSPSS